MQLNADLKAVDEDKDRLFAKLSDEVKAKEELQGESAVRFCAVVTSDINADRSRM